MLTAWRDCASVTPIRCSLTRVNKKANSRLGGRTDTGRWTSTVLCLLLFRLHYSVSMQWTSVCWRYCHFAPSVACVVCILCDFCSCRAPQYECACHGHFPNSSVLSKLCFCSLRWKTFDASTVVASMCIFNVCRSMFAAFIGNRTLTKRPFQGSCLFIFLFSEAQTRNTSLLGWVSKQIGNPA